MTRSGNSAEADIYGSQNGIDWIFLVAAVEDAYIDLSGTGFAYVGYLKLEGKDNRGTSSGYDLDAVLALNSAPIPIPGTLCLLATGLIGLAGFSRKFRKR